MEEEEEDEVEDEDAEPDEEEEECSRLVAVRAQSAGENPSVQPITSSSSSSSITEQLSADLMVERPDQARPPPWRRNYLLKNYGWPSYVQLLFCCLSCLAQDEQLLGSLGQVRNKTRQSGGWPWRRGCGGGAVKQQASPRSVAVTERTILTVPPPGGCLLMKYELRRV